MKTIQELNEVINILSSMFKKQNIHSSVFIYIDGIIYE